MAVPIVGRDDHGQVVYLGECRAHGWHGRTACPKCLKAVVGRNVQRSPLPSPPDHKPTSHLIVVSASLVRRRARGRRKIMEEGACRMCERSHSVRPLTRHHLVPDRFFRWQPMPTRSLAHVDPNIVPLCRPCHDLVEEPDRTIREEARRMLRRTLAQEELTFMIQVRGRAWVDKHYPTRP